MFPVARMTGLLVAVAASIGGAGVAAADVSTALPLPLGVSGCVQSFDTLAGSGSSPTFPAGFGLAELGSNADVTYAAGDGSSTAGNTYSFGVTGSSERALGGLSSGGLQSRYGVLVRNDTGGLMTSLGVSFRTEQWRHGSATAPNRTVFAYSPTATSLAGPEPFTAVPALDAVGVTLTPANSSLNGNSPANQRTVAATLTGLAVPPAGTLVLRWSDPDETGSDDGIGIDDLTLAPNGASTPTAPCPGAPVPPLVVTKIHDLQGRAPISPLVGQSATIEGVVTGVDDLVGSSFGSANTVNVFPTDRGFYVQEVDGRVDADATTSEGVFVGLTSAATALPAIGAQVRVTGTVKDGQFPPAFGQTRLEAGGFTVQATGLALPAAVDIDPAAAAAQTVGGEGNPTRSYYETLEGMRVRLVAGVAHSGGTNKFGELFLRVGTAPGTLLRTDPIAADLIATAADAGAGNPSNPYDPPLPSTTVVHADKADTVSNLIGPLGYSFGHYKIVPQVGLLPAVTSTGVTYPYDRLAPPTTGQVRVAAFNLENIFPEGGALDGHVVTAAEFGVKRDRSADAIGRLMHAPDVVAVMEIGDNQHLGQSGATTSLATLQAVATRLGELGYGTYTAYALEGNDSRGIDVGFLVKSTVTVLAGPDQRGGLTAAGACSDVAGRLFDRPPLFLRVDLGALGTPWLVANHFASKAAPDSCRDAQADFVRQQVEAIHGGGDEVIVMGDLNAFEDESPLAHLEQGGTLTNLWAYAPARDRYSFQFNGVLQTLDHILVTAGVQAKVVTLNYAHFDNDYFDRGAPADGHKTSDHDPPVLTLAEPPPPTVPETPSPWLMTVGALGIGILAASAARPRRRGGPGSARLVDGEQLV